MRLQTRGAEDFVGWALSPGNNAGLAKIAGRYAALDPLAQTLALRTLADGGERSKWLAKSLDSYDTATQAARRELVTGVGKKPSHVIAAWIRETAQIIRRQLPLGHAAHTSCADELGAIVHYRVATLRAGAARRSDDAITAALLRAIGDSGATLYDGASVLAGYYAALEDNPMRCLRDVIHGLRDRGFDVDFGEKERPFAATMMAWGDEQNGPGEPGARRDPYLPMARWVASCMKSSVG